MPEWATPYLILQQGLNQYAQNRSRRTDREYQRERDILQDTRQKEIDEMLRKEREFNFDRAQKQAKSQDALNQFDITADVAPAVEPPNNFGPPMPNAFDATQPWHAQSPIVQQTALRGLQQAGVNPLQAISLFNEIVAAQTGRPILPEAPEGMRMGKLDIGGATFEPNVEPPKLAGFEPTSTTVDGVRYEKKNPVLPPRPKEVFLGDSGMSYWIDENTGEKIPTPAGSEATVGDKALASNSSEILTNLNTLKKVIQDYGTFEAARGVPNLPMKGENSDLNSTEASAMLKSLPYKIAIQYAKIVDPATAAREGEVAAAQKFLIPIGLGADNNQALAIIDEMIAETKRRIQLNNQMGGVEIPIPVEEPGAGNAQPPPKFNSVQEAEAANLPQGTRVLVFDPATRRFRPAEIQ